eukprot:364397-Chlamydomonas_euryale.AAC.7
MARGSIFAVSSRASMDPNALAAPPRRAGPKCEFPHHSEPVTGAVTDEFLFAAYQALPLFPFPSLHSAQRGPRCQITRTRPSRLRPRVRRTASRLKCLQHVSAAGDEQQQQCRHCFLFSLVLAGPRFAESLVSIDHAAACFLPARCRCLADLPAAGRHHPQERLHCHQRQALQGAEGHEEAATQRATAGGRRGGRSGGGGCGGSPHPSSWNRLLANLCHRASLARRSRMCPPPRPASTATPSATSSALTSSRARSTRT